MNKPLEQVTISRDNYREFPGLNYSLIAEFCDSPERAAAWVEPKSYFEIGKAYELLIEDEITGSSLFDERFFVARLPLEMPEKLAAWIEAGEDLEQFYRYNKDGSLSGRYKTLHAWLDACVDHPGKMPISNDEFDMLKKMVENTLKIELLGLTLREILKGARFQVPLHWTDDFGIEKKALLDAVATVFVNGSRVKLPIDFKTAANKIQFLKMLKSKYWVQDRHYLDGFLRLYPDGYSRMIFITALKDDTRIAQPFQIEEDSITYIEPKYRELAENCDAWVKAGKPLRGWQELEDIKIFV